MKTYHWTWLKLNKYYCLQVVDWEMRVRCEKQNVLHLFSNLKTIARKYCSVFILFIFFRRNKLISPTGRINIQTQLSGVLYSFQIFFFLFELENMKLEEYPYFHISIVFQPLDGLCVITLLPVVTPPHFLLEPLPFPVMKPWCEAQGTTVSYWNKHVACCTIHLFSLYPRVFSDDYWWNTQHRVLELPRQNKMHVPKTLSHYFTS